MKSVHLTAISAMTGLLLASSASATNLVGYWNFNNPSDPYHATVGSDLTLSGSDSAAPVNLGNGDGARQIGESGVAGPSGNYYTVQNPVGANGGGTLTNDYTLLYDVYVPSTDTNSYITLLKTTTPTTKTANDSPTNDSQLFIKLSQGNVIGGNASMGTYSDTGVPNNAWSRIVMTVNPVDNNGHLDVNLYLNGSLVYNNSDHLTFNGSPTSVFDGDLALHPTFWIFRDNDSDADTIDVTNLAYWDGALSADQVAALGGADTPVMPATPEPASLALLGLGGLGLLSRRRRTVRADARS